MIKLVDIFKQYGGMFTYAPNIEVGEYELKNFYLFDNAKYERCLYFDTTKGMFKTGSKNMISTIRGGLGDILQKYFEKGETVLIEIVNRRGVTGKFGLVIRTV